MRSVFSSTDRSLVASVRLALEAEGIAVVVEESHGALPFVPVRVLVADSEYDRAQELIRDIAPRTSASYRPDWLPRAWSMTLIVIVILTIIVCGRIFLW